MPFLKNEYILREYIRATAMGLPDPRGGSGYGSVSTKPGGIGSTYQKQGTYPYREPDVLDDLEDEEDEEEVSTKKDKRLHNKINLTHTSVDPYKRRDHGSFSGHSVRFDLHQGFERKGSVVKETMISSTGKSITPIPDLYKGRSAGGATGGVSPSGYTSGPVPKGGVTSTRSYASSQKLPRDEKKPRKYRLVDILYGDDDNIILMIDEEV